MTAGRQGGPPRPAPGHSLSWRLILGDGGPAGPAGPVGGGAPGVSGAAVGRIAEEPEDRPGEPPGDGALNMAVDRALLDAVIAGAGPVLRLYRWSPATLSFGRNQPARGLYDEAAAARRGIAFVRRPTGGQAVLHDDELTYAVAAPVSVLGKPRAAYRRINEAIVAALRTLGLDAEIAAAGESIRGDPIPGVDRGGAPAWSEACFRRPERGEVVVGGRKLVGSAQRTESRTILQHGSILLGGSQSPAESLLLKPPHRGAASAGTEGDWTTLESELGDRPSSATLLSALISGFEETVGISLARTTLTPEESAGAVELRERFGSRAWTWRR